MEISNIFTIGVGSAAIFGGLYWLINNFKSSSLLDMFKKKSEQKAQQLLAENKELTKQQKAILKQIEITNTLSEEKKKEIDKKLEKVAVEINEVLKTGTIEEIDKIIDSEWKGL